MLLVLAAPASPGLRRTPASQALRPGPRKPDRVRDPLLGTDPGDGNVASVMGDALVGRVVFSMAKVEGAWCCCGE